MTELHADNLKKSYREHYEAFNLARIGLDWRKVDDIWRKMLFLTEAAINEARNASQEVDTLAAELSTYRPMRSDRPAAPRLEGYAYVFTGKSPWVCVAVELRKVYVAPASMGGWTQEHFVPEKKTVCGKAVSYPVTERFTSGGWPRLHELCPECTAHINHLSRGEAHSS